MLYWGRFRSVLEDQLYEVQIITGHNINQRTEITLGANPFTVTMDPGGNTIYEPIHSTVATIEIVSAGYYFDMFSSKPLDNFVALYKLTPISRIPGKYNSTLEWAGYTQPCTYSTPFTNQIETWTIEAIDCLGVLQYMDYEAGGVSEIEQSDGTVKKEYSKDIVSFHAIIDGGYQRGMIHRFYEQDDPIFRYRWEDGHYESLDKERFQLTFPSNMYQQYIRANNGKSLLEMAKISEQNFFDEGDKPMTCLDVLSEICKYLSSYAVINYHPYVGTSYPRLDIVDIDYCFMDSSDGFPRYTLSSDDFAGTDATLTLDPVYNKVTVRDSMYTVDSVLPSLWDEENLRNIMSYPWTDGNDSMHDSMFGGYTNRVWVTDSKKITDEKYGYWQWYGKYFVNRMCYHAPAPTSSITNTQHVSTFPGFGEDSDFRMPTWLNSGKGALFAKMDVEWIGNKKAEDAWTDRTFFLNKHQYNWTDYICLFLNDYATENDSLLTFVGETNQKPFLTSTDSYFLITGSMQPDDRQNVPFPLSNYEENKDECEIWDLYLVLKLQVSTINAQGVTVYYYWNGSEWTTSECTFHLPFHEDISMADYKHWMRLKHFNGVKFSVRNNVTPEMGIDTNGYVIPMLKPSNTTKFVASKPVISIYGRGRINSNYRMDRIWISDFDVQVVQPKIGGAAEEDSDTEYTMYIDEDNVQELGDIEFKICTWDSKNVNYSTPVDASTLNPIDVVFTRDDFGYRPEELYCLKIVNQYSTPSKREALTLRANRFNPQAIIHDPVLNIDCVIDKYTLDYGSDSMQLEIVEKKQLTGYAHN